MTRCVVFWPGAEEDLEAPSLRAAAAALVRRARAEPGEAEITVRRVATAAFPGAQALHLRLTDDPRRDGRFLAYVVADFPPGDFPPDMAVCLRAAIAEQVTLAALRAPANAVRQPEETARA